MTNTPQLIEVDIEQLIKADWNFKSNSTDEQIRQLANSINEDRSAGVLAVREVKGGKFEVIDGNHRLDAICLLGWQRVQCENFGKISKAKAITIARRRNYEWFQVDMMRYAEEFTNNVLSEYSLDKLATFMPDSIEDMKNLSKMLEFDWSMFSSSSTEGGVLKEKRQELVLYLSREVWDMWKECKGRVLREFLESKSDEECFEIVIKKFLKKGEAESV